MTDGSHNAANAGPINLPRTPNGFGKLLEPVIESTTASGIIRIGTPLSPGWRSERGRWRRLARAEVLLLTRTPIQSGRILLLERGEPSRVVSHLGELPAGIPGAEALGWLGWPSPVGDDGTGPATIQERLRARSNDYWLLETVFARLNRAEVPPLPGVSVVIPARGVEGTIAEVVYAIVTAAGQLPPGTPWECLIVDDHSERPIDPGTGDTRVRVLPAPQRVYCGGGRNLGVRNAAYPIVAFVDGDTSIAANYLLEHALRHLIMPNLITVSLREQLRPGIPIPKRAPDGSRDTRVQATYHPGRQGLVPVTASVTVRAIDETNQFRDFGFGRHLGPVDLPFMVKGNNLAVSMELARIGFPPDFVGYGPEDGTYAAKAIARGAFVVPVLDTAVFHREHPPRSGDSATRDAELAANLIRQARHLRAPADGPWVTSTGAKGEKR